MKRNQTATADGDRSSWEVLMAQNETRETERSIGDDEFVDQEFIDDEDDTLEDDEDAADEEEENPAENR
jgi:hypothetical protein